MLEVCGLQKEALQVHLQTHGCPDPCGHPVASIQGHTNGVPRPVGEGRCAAWSTMSASCLPRCLRSSCVHRLCEQAA